MAIAACSGNIIARKPGVFLMELRSPAMSSDPSPHLPVNHVFVDVENVKGIDPAVIGEKNLRLHLFLGAQQKKLDVEVVEKLLEHSQTVQMIRSPKSGKNALDFVLAYHLGQAVQGDPKGYFHIVSKDAGFDALVELLKSRHVKVRRHDDWAALHFHSVSKAQPTAPAVPKAQAQVKAQATPKSSASPVLSAAAERLVENLKKLPKPKRPKKEKSLISLAKSISAKDVTDAAIAQVFTELKKAKLIAVDDKGDVVYQV